jgi:hypothetical protein
MVDVLEWIGVEQHQVSVPPDLDRPGIGAEELGHRDGPRAQGLVRAQAGIDEEREFMVDGKARHVEDLRRIRPQQ